MLIFAGLGNPGAEYASHRHNVGFMAADAIARRHSFSSWTKKFQALLAEGRLGDEKVVLLKPQQFMNRSGQAIGEALRFYKLPVSRLVVLHDELDLAAGKVRVKTGGGTGGHNGIRSIDAHCSGEYRRVRIGIGHPGTREGVTAHVLGNFSKADQDWLQPVLESIAAHADLLAKGDDSGFMNRISLDMAASAPAQSAKRPVAGRSHGRTAPAREPIAQPPPGGPMAAMLKRLFGKD